TASTLPTAERGPPYTIVCCHACPSQWETTAPSAVAPAAQTSPAARTCSPYTEPGSPGSSCQRPRSRRSSTCSPSRVPISQVSPPPVTTLDSSTPAGGGHACQAEPS